MKKDLKSSTYIPLFEYIKTENPQTSKIKLKILKEKIREHKCECCNNTTWNNKPIPLEVHHKDGNRKNNSLDNLQLLCPNCHAMTDNWRGRGKKTTVEHAYVSDEDLIDALQKSENIRQALLSLNIPAKGRNYDRAKELCKKFNIIFLKNTCMDCGKTIKNTSLRCKECENKLRRIEATNDLPINREELKELIRTISFLQIGKQFNVSDNTIRKWCRNLNLPCRSHDIKKISDEEWEKI